MIRSALRRRAVLAGTVAAAAGGALTAGLVSGIGHLAADTSGKVATPPTTAPLTTAAPSASATSTPKRSERHRTTPSATRTRSKAESDSGGGNVAPAPPQAAPQGGSNGS